MSRFVLDCSVGISWFMPDETNDDAEAILAFLGEGSEAIVPSIFWLEIVNVLLVAERRNRIGEEDVTEALAMLSALRILVDANTVQQSTGATLELARQYRLAAYDAAYLELALREELPLATIDNRLAEAARDCGVFMEIPTLGDIEF
ncbi:MAG: type II toxin-antitoxin system VapC family toxin [Oscillatoria sp. SIO1A7]|nr:type II toxin-antitoxin system VapC family toxin [Oscillatoria sp. SIO1A7]